MSNNDKKKSSFVNHVDWYCAVLPEATSSAWGLVSNMYIWFSQWEIYWARTQQLTCMSCMISLDILKLVSDILLTVSVMWLESISSHILLQSWHCSSNTSDDVTSCRQHAPLISSSSGAAAAGSEEEAAPSDCERDTNNVRINHFGNPGLLMHWKLRYWARRKIEPILFYHIVGHTFNYF